MLGMALPTKGTATPMVMLRQFNNVVSIVVGNGVLGVPSAANAPVLLYPSRVKATLLAR